MAGLGYLNGGVSSSAEGVSGNGSVVVGSSNTAAGHSEAFRWSLGNGMQAVGTLPGYTDSRAIGVNADASVVVGDALPFKQGPPTTEEAFILTPKGGLQGLGFLPSDTFTEVKGVSADGTVVIGESGFGPRSEAFRWAALGGMLGLGDLPGGASYSVAFAASADGSVVVGKGSGSSGGEEAFVWDAFHGIRQLKAVLENDFGFDLTGWEMNEARGISADGMTIVGTSRNPAGNYEAYIAHLPEPATLSLVVIAIAMASKRRRCQG
jgi:probable HAF family extracellular repeat protein